MGWIERHGSLASLVIAVLALFVALGGPAAAVDLINGKTIKKETVTAKQVKDGSLSDRELNAATVSAFREVAANSVNGASVADGSLGAADLGSNAVNGASVADGSLGAADLGANSVDSARVQDGTMRGVDVGRFSGSAAFNFGVIGVGACAPSTSASLPSAAGQDIRDDAISVTPESSLPLSAVTVAAQPTGVDQITIVLCNQTAGAVNIGMRTFRYLTVDVEGA